MNVDLQPSSWGEIELFSPPSHGERKTLLTSLPGDNSKVFLHLPWGRDSHFQSSPRGGQRSIFPRPPRGTSRGVPCPLLGGRLVFRSSPPGGEECPFSLLSQGERNIDLQPCSRGDEYRSSTLLLGRDRTLFTSLPWGEKDSFNVSPRGEKNSFLTSLPGDNSKVFLHLPWGRDSHFQSSPRGGQRSIFPRPPRGTSRGVPCPLLGGRLVFRSSPPGGDECPFSLLSPGERNVDLQPSSRGDECPFSLLSPGERNVDLQPSSRGGIVYLSPSFRDEGVSVSSPLGRNRICLVNFTANPTHRTV